MLNKELIASVVLRKVNYYPTHCCIDALKKIHIITDAVIQVLLTLA